MEKDFIRRRPDVKLIFEETVSGWVQPDGSINFSADETKNKHRTFLKKLNEEAKE